MSTSHWHKFYTASIQAPPGVLFDLLADMPDYGRWLPGSSAFGSTTDVDPYPVRLGSRYHDGKPGEPGRDWWGTVTGFQPPGSLDFHHVIHIAQLRAKTDVHIHYSLEQDGDHTAVNRWLILDVSMPFVLRPLRGLITASFDRENVRTMAALKTYAEAQAKRSAEPGSLSVRLATSVVAVCRADAVPKQRAVFSPSALQPGPVKVEVPEQADFGAMVNDFIEHVQRQINRAGVGVRSPGRPERRIPLTGSKPGQSSAPALVMLVKESGDSARANREVDLVHGEFRVAE
jgi:hypothetical protein